MRIKSAFVDCIEMYKHRKKELKNLSTKLIQVEQDLTEIKTNDLINLLQNLDGYFFEDNHIIYNRFLTDLEIKKRTKEIKQGMDYDVYRLEKWCNDSEDNSKQIKEYLKLKNISIKNI